MSTDLNFVVVDIDAGVPLADRVAYAAAQQRQLREHFSPLWDGLGETSCVRAATPDAPAKAGEVQIQLLKNAPATQQGALAFHASQPDGTPICYVFVGLIASYGQSWQSAASHEVLETMGDPRLRLCVELDDGTIWDRENCFTGDTKISLLNGTEVAIKDLVGVAKFWVYSCTPDGNIVAGRGHSARVARQDAELVAVTLDSGDVVRCTPDHRFQLRDGSYCEARTLAEGVSLMPLYRRREPIATSKDAKSQEYEQVMNPADRSWKFTHRVVNPRCPNGYVRHHVDFDRFNNEPTNLRTMRKEDHIKLHGDVARERNLAWVAAGTHPWQRPKSPAERARSSVQIRKYNASPERMVAYRRWSADAIANGKHPWQQPQSAEKRAQSAANLTAYNKSDAHREVAARVGGETLRKLWQDPDYVGRIATLNGERMKRQNADPVYQEKRLAALKRYHDSDHEYRPLSEESRAKLSVSLKARFADQTDAERAKRAESSRRTMHKRWHINRNVVNPTCSYCAAPNNHKVVSVAPAGREDVYDITVDDTANFALTAGVFVHNCDRVEALSYLIDGVELSNFNTPECFEPPSTTSGVKYDYLGASNVPNQVLPGGYAQQFTLDKGWVQHQAGKLRPYRVHMLALGLSRGARRIARSAPKSWWRRLLSFLHL